MMQRTGTVWKCYRNCSQKQSIKIFKNTKKGNEIMKKMKRMLAFVLAMVMVLATGITAFADEPGTTPKHSITIENENPTISIDGKTYRAYKLFDSTHVGTAYAYTMSTTSQFYSEKLVTGTAVASGSLEELLRTYFTFTAVTGDSTIVNVAPKTGFDANAARAFADAIQEFLSDKTATASAEAENETAVISLDGTGAGLGYYIVTGDAAPTDPDSTETVVSAVILTNEDPNPVVNPKAGIPTLGKKITGVAEGTTAVDNALLDNEGKAAVAKVGSTVSYEIDSIVPDLTGYSDYTFVIGDAITAGLDYVKDSFVLMIDGTEVDIDPVFALDDAATADINEADRSFTLTIPYNTLKAYAAGDPIVLTYDATVNADSLSYDYVNNTAKLTYSNNPYTDETNDTPNKKTYVVNMNLDVYKVAAGEVASGSDAAEKLPLEGAEFVLYRVVEVEKEGQQKPVEEKQYYKWDTTNNVVTWVAMANAETLTTDTDGKLSQQIRGLDKGTYYLVETKAPTGYNLLKDPVEIEITATKTGDKVTYSAQIVTRTEIGTSYENVTVNNKTIDLSLSQPTESQPVAVPTIENSTGVELPSTGGIGTTIFYVIGSILALAAGVILVTRRRMSMNG